MKENSITTELPPETGGRANRVNPRIQRRCLSAEIEIAGENLIHGTSQEISPFGASFVITENSGAVSKLKVGDQVIVRTTLARKLRAEINSIRPGVGTDGSSPVIGMKLLDGQRWLDHADLDESLFNE